MAGGFHVNVAPVPSGLILQSTNGRVNVTFGNGIIPLGVLVEMLKCRDKITSLALDEIPTFRVRQLI